MNGHLSAGLSWLAARKSRGSLAPIQSSCILCACTESCFERTCQTEQLPDLRWSRGPHVNLLTFLPPLFLCGFISTSVSTACHTTSPAQQPHPTKVTHYRHHCSHITQRHSRLWLPNVSRSCSSVGITPDAAPLSCDTASSTSSNSAWPLKVLPTLGLSEQLHAGISKDKHSTARS
jgi:hypothetical protein